MDTQARCLGARFIGARGPVYTFLFLIVIFLMANAIRKCKCAHRNMAVVYFLPRKTVVKREVTGTEPGSRRPNFGTLSQHTALTKEGEHYDDLERGIQRTIRTL